MKNLFVALLLMNILVSCGENGGNAPGAACGGAEVGGYCWYLANETSCDTACASHGGYNEATRTFAGSDGTDQNCSDVADAIGMSGTTVTEVSVGSGTDGWGCISDFSVRLRHERPTNSTASGPSVERACACNE